MSYFKWSIGDSTFEVSGDAGAVKDERDRFIEELEHEDRALVSYATQLRYPIGAQVWRVGDGAVHAGVILAWAPGRLQVQTHQPGGSIDVGWWSTGDVFTSEEEAMQQI